MHLNSRTMKQFFLFQLFWMASFTLSAQSNVENTLKTANPAAVTVEVPLADQTVLRTENPLNKATENTLKAANPAAVTVEVPLADQTVLRTQNPFYKATEITSIVTDQKIQNPTVLPTENPINKNTELVEPKKN